MPMPYIAPEIALEVPWGYPVDIWCVRLTARDLLGLNGLFSADHTADHMYEPAHLAEFIAVLGPPPAAFWAYISRAATWPTTSGKRSSSPCSPTYHHVWLNPEKAAQFWDEDGKWKDIVPIPQTACLSR